MSYFRIYSKGEIVKADQGVWSPFPTLGPCTVECEVLQDSTVPEVEVYLKPTDPEVGGPKYVSKDRIDP